MKKFIITTLLCLAVSLSASEKSDKKAAEKQKKELLRQKLNASAYAIAKSNPKSAAKLIKKSLKISEDNPTGCYIGAGLKTTSDAKKLELLESAATSSKSSSYYKQEAIRKLSSKNSETALTEFLNALSTKAMSEEGLDAELLTIWVLAKAKQFPDKINLARHIEQILTAVSYPHEYTDIIKFLHTA